MSDVVIFGTGQMAETIAIYLERDSPHQIVGYTVDSDVRKGQTEFRGKPVYDWECLEEHFQPSDGLLFGPVSYRKLNQFRKARYEEGKARGYTFLSFVHPATHIYADSIGENCLILEQNVVQPRATIGNNVILWSNNHIGHHTVIGDHCFLTSQVGIAGNCHIGQACFFGGQSGVIDNLRIGDSCLIGAGTLVRKDLENGDFILAPPARVIQGAAPRITNRLLG